MDKANNEPQVTPYDPLADSLGIETELTVYDPDKDLPAHTHEDRFVEIVDADYEFARDKIMSAILQAADSLSEIAQVAKQSQAPRAYEVVATLTKTIFDGNKDLMAIAMAKQKIAGSEFQKNDETGKTINNNLFVGSTEDFQKFLRTQGIETNTRTMKTVEIDDAEQEQPRKPEE